MKKQIEKQNQKQKLKSLAMLSIYVGSMMGSPVARADELQGASGPSGYHRRYREKHAFDLLRRNDQRDDLSY